MKRSNVLSLFIFFCLLMSTTLAAQYKKALPDEKWIDVVKGNVQWWGYKVVKSQPTSHYGNFNLKSGKFLFKKRVLVGGEFLVDMKSVTSTDLVGEENAKLIEDLKSPLFFDIKKYPTAKFTITRLIPSKSGQYNYTVVGNLLLKGVLKTISFPANIHIDEFRVDFHSAKFTINRQDFNIFYKSAMQDYLIKDEIDLEVTLQSTGEKTRRR